ncbi:MAG TPA: phosphoribosyltransferase family protein [Caulobacteraceae bacterium]|nr:phosphoribosyltransferase family protein [Caulobacteraceae bacterium]
MVEPRQGLKVLLGPAEIAPRVEALAERLAPLIDDDWIIAPILLGAMWFAADLTRALARRGRSPSFDALWLASYGDKRASSGEARIVASLQRPIAGRPVLILDEVVETGVSLAAAATIAHQAGAAQVLTAVFALKPAAGGRAIEPDLAAWQAPDEFLVGYGMDLGGRFRDLPWIGAAGEPG